MRDRPQPSASASPRLQSANAPRPETWQGTMSEDYTTFEWKGRFGPFELLLSEHTFPPSRLSLLLGDALEVRPGDVVIDLGCGSGVLAIVAGKLGAGSAYGVDVAPDTEKIATMNAERQGVGHLSAFFQGDLFAPLPPGVQADLVIGDVSGIPDAVARISGWFPSSEGGGPHGSELPQRMLEQAPGWLKPDGRLLLPTGTLQSEAPLLAAAREHFASVEHRREQLYPLPDSIAESPELQALLEEGVIELERRGSRLLWKASVWECTGLDARR